MIDERSSSSILRKTLSEPQTGIEPATFWWPVRRSNHWATKTQVAHICRTCTLALHISLGSSMIRASHRSSEGCRFDRRLGLRNRFSEDRAWRSLIRHLTVPNLYLKILGVPLGASDSHLSPHFFNRCYGSEADYHVFSFTSKLRLNGNDEFYSQQSSLPSSALALSLCKYENVKV